MFVIEHIIFHNIMSHLNANNILIENQHSFRVGGTQLIIIIPYQNTDHQKQLDIILLHFAKEFDTVLVLHQRLFTKLQCYGITNIIFNWIKTWLTDQTRPESNMLKRFPKMLSGIQIS